MKNKRIIPRLDIKGPNLVKGIHLEGLRVLGKPEEFAKIYYDHGADELIYQDVVASLYQRNSLKEIISKTVKNIFIPITVGGGIRSLKDINDVLRAGADKVCINTAAVKNPNFIKEASKVFGSSTIVISIEVCKDNHGNYKAFTDNGREETDLDALEWAEYAQDLGAGEILITSIDREGTGEGFDINLCAKLKNILTIPIIAHGGAKDSENISNLFSSTDVDAACLASTLHYNALSDYKTSIKNSSLVEGNISFINRDNKKFKNFGMENLKQIKKKLKNDGINIRINI